MSMVRIIPIEDATWAYKNKNHTKPIADIIA